MKALLHILVSVFVVLAGITIFHSCRKDEMKVETTGVKNIMATTVIAEGSIISMGEGVELHGHCWDTTANPTINASKTENGTIPKTGPFTSQLTALEAGKTYHIRAYLQTGNEVVYGRDITFSTLDGKAILITTEVTNISFYSALSGGNISSVNGDTVLSRGVCWDTLTTVDLKVRAGFTTNGSGTSSFPSELSGLIPGRTYYVKAYAITSTDTSYATPRSFKSLSGKATIATIDVTSVTDTTAIAGGNIISDGGSSINARGVCYGTNENPTIEDNNITDGTGTGAYANSLTGLIPNTTYYFRAYATNAITTTYGYQKSFLTKGLPELTTTKAANLTVSTATCGGNVTEDWGYPVTSRGVCWSTSQNPNTVDSRTTVGSGPGSFTSILSGLIPGVTYYVRAYATNSVGTGYGEQRAFILQGPTVVVEIINPVTGRTWMDRNLGASRAATNVNDSNAYGALYQWGRSSDGHQIRTSDTTTTLGYTDSTAYGSFITSEYTSSFDWRYPQNGNLWQGVNGINNPCPSGYRLPTAGEWEAERKSWTSNNAAGAFSSPLKLTLGGVRQASDGSFRSLNAIGYYWSSTIGPTTSYHGQTRSDSRYLFILSTSAYMLNGGRANGNSVRCIKD